jgi:hypothetical protein
VWGSKRDLEQHAGVCCAALWEGSLFLLTYSPSLTIDWCQSHMSCTVCCSCTVSMHSLCLRSVMARCLQAILFVGSCWRHERRAAEASACGGRGDGAARGMCGPGQHLPGAARAARGMVCGLWVGSWEGRFSPFPHCFACAFAAKCVGLKQEEHLGQCMCYKLRRLSSSFFFKKCDVKSRRLNGVSLLAA